MLYTDEQKVSNIDEEPNLTFNQISIDKCIDVS